MVLLQTVPVKVQRSRAGLNEAAGTADQPAERHGIRAIESQDRVVGDTGRESARRAAVSDLQRARRNQRSAVIGVGTAENERSGVGQREGPRAADRAGKGQLRPAGRGEIGITGQHQRRGDRVRARAHCDQRRPAGGAERQDVRAAALQHVAAGAAEGHRAEAAGWCPT